MAATVTTLDRAIAREERRVGLPTDIPLTETAIAHRHLQVAIVLGGCGFLALFAAIFGEGVVRAIAIAIGVVFAVYALETNRHLRRLAGLRDDSQRISLVVANELLMTGALAPDRELLDLRDAIAQCAGRLASDLPDVLAAECVRVRLLGPAGEVPVAAELGAHPVTLDDTDFAIEAVRTRGAIRATAPGARGVLVVPVWRDGDILGLVEAIAPAGCGFTPGDVSRVDAYARGAVAALLATR